MLFELASAWKPAPLRAWHSKNSTPNLTKKNQVGCRNDKLETGLVGPLLAQLAGIQLEIYIAVDGHGILNTLPASIAPRGPRAYTRYVPDNRDAHAFTSHLVTMQLHAV